MLAAELVSAPRLGALLGMKPGTVYDWARTQQVPSVKVGRSLRFRLDKIEELLVERPAIRPLRPPLARVYRIGPMANDSEKRSRGVYERKAGSGVWWVRYADENGKIHREPVGPKAVALAVYRKRKTEVAERRFFPEGRKSITVEGAIKAHLASQEARGILSLKDQQRYGTNWTAFFGDKPLRSVQPEDVEAYINKRMGDVEPATVNHEVKFLRRVFTVAVNNEWCRKNPVKSITLLRENNARIRFLADDEETALRKELGAADWSLVDFAINTGLRRGEQFKLTWAMVDMDRRQLTIPRSKNGERRHVSLNDTAMRILRQAPSRLVSEFVFTGENNKARDSHNFYRRVFMPALEDAGIKDFCWHDLRHTFASRLVMAGVDLRTVQALMGHKTLDMTTRYAHLSPAHQLEAVNRLVSRKSTDTSTDTGAPATVREAPKTS